MLFDIATRSDYISTLGHKKIQKALEEELCTSCRILSDHKKRNVGNVLIFNWRVFYKKIHAKLET